jgi:hypothetical protein
MRQQYAVVGPELLGPVSDFSVNYRPVLSSKRALHAEKKRKGIIWSWALKKRP